MFKVVTITGSCCCGKLCSLCDAKSTLKMMRPNPVHILNIPVTLVHTPSSLLYADKMSENWWIKSLNNASVFLQCSVFYKRLLVWFCDSYRGIFLIIHFSTPKCFGIPREEGVSQTPSQLLSPNAFRNASKWSEPQTASVEQVLRTISSWLRYSHRSEMTKANSRQFSLDWLTSCNQSSGLP